MYAADGLAVAPATNCFEGDFIEKRPSGILKQVERSELCKPASFCLQLHRLSLWEEGSVKEGMSQSKSRLLPHKNTNLLLLSL